MVGKDERRQEGQVNSGIPLMPTDEPMMGIGGEIGIKVEDKHGNVVKQFNQPMQTFVDNASAAIMCGFLMTCDAAAGFSVTEVGGAAKNIAYNSQVNAGDYCVIAAIGNDNFGVLVGTSNTAWGWTQHNLQGKISHGTGSGQLTHGVTTRSYTADGGAPATCTVQRSFDNNSGADITVREIGWFLTAMVGTAQYFMIARDVITATIVPNGGRLTVTYNIKINPT